MQRYKDIADRINAQRPEGSTYSISATTKGIANVVLYRFLRPTDPLLTRVTDVEVNTRVLDEVADEVVALVIAHEMSHSDFAPLSHRNYRQRGHPEHKAAELKADINAVKLACKAGYDIREEHLLAVGNLEGYVKNDTVSHPAFTSRLNAQLEVLKTVPKVEVEVVVKTVPKVEVEPEVKTVVEPSVPKVDPKFDLNAASYEDLEALDYVGPALAKRIIETRTKAPFANWQEFDDRVKGMSMKIVKSISAQGMKINGLPHQE